MASLVAGAGTVIALAAIPASTAYATTPAYELFCPNTPVGSIVLNGAVTSGTITPASPATGSQFNLTGYQTIVNLPSALASAAAALGNTAIAGTAVAKVDATGATPASISGGTIPISSPIPSPVPAAGITLDLPAAPATIGPFTASGGTISLTEDSAAQLTLQVSGSPLSLTCTAYPNNTAPTGITTSKPSGTPTSPVIATASASGSSTPTSSPATTAPSSTPTSTPATTAPLAFTGAGPHLWMLAIIGAVVLYLGLMAFALVEGPRSLARRVLRLAHAGAGAGPAPGSGGHTTVADPPVAPVDHRWTAEPDSAEPHGLWLEGCEPEEHN